MRTRRMSATGRALMAVSAAVAVIAAFWPQLAPHFTRASRSLAKSSGSSSACPLGYTSSDAENATLPIGHPAVRGSKQAASSQQRQDVIWFSGDIWTGDEARPWAGAMAVDAVTGEILQMADELPSGGSEVAQFVGGFLMPGIVDSHTHFIPGGLSLSSADLRRASSKEEFISIVQEAAEKLGPNDWVLGGFWDDNQWGGGLPDASWIDEACGGRPALLMRMDSHLALANTAALQLAGVGPDTPDPEEGIVDKDAETGQPTGILRETAMRLVSSVVPTPSAERRQGAVLDAARYALSRGITSIVDFGRSPFADKGASWADLEEVYDPMADSEKLPLRVYAFVPIDQWGALATRVAAAGFSHPSGRLHVGGVKAFADGSLGSRTALMHEDYSDQFGNRGKRMVALDTLRRDAAAADAAGLQIAVHAIGDCAVDDVLDVFEEVISKRRGPKGVAPARAPLRVEHAQHIGGAVAARRFGELAAHVVPVANPQHLLTDAPMLEARLGQERAAPDRSFAWQVLAAAGAKVAAGSDWPVVDAQPFQGIAAAVERAREQGGGVGGWERAVSDALMMHTAMSADAAVAMGRQVGRLVPGRKADFVVLSSSPFGMEGQAAAGLEGLKVWRTYVDGRCAYGCDEAAGEDGRVHPS